MVDPINKISKQSKADVTHAIVKAGLSAIPLIGGAAAELFQCVIQPPLEKRREKWMVAVGEKLQELELSGIKLENLQNNEEFVSLVMYATMIALRTHQEEKLSALRNAIANVAIGQAPDEVLQHIFLSLIDTFNSLHLKVLKLFQSPVNTEGLSMGALSHVLENKIPELKNNRELCDLLWKDLFFSPRQKYLWVDLGTGKSPSV